MGKQTGLNTFTGKLANMIGYTVNGEHRVRSYPAHVNQSPATRARALDFGKASRLGRSIRHALSGVLQLPDESTRVNRLNRALFEAYHMRQADGSRGFRTGNLRILTGFQLNTHTPLSQLITAPYTITRDGDGHIAIALPALKSGENLHCNPGATHALIKASALEVNLEDNTTTAIASAPLIVDLKSGSAAATITLPATGRHITCIVLEVSSHVMADNRLIPLYDRKFHAAEVIAVLQPKKEQGSQCTVTCTDTLPALKMLLPYFNSPVIDVPSLE